MKKINRLLFCVLAILIILTPFFAPRVQAEMISKQVGSYEAIVDDQANLLDESEREELLSYLISITENGGNAVFLSVDDNPTTEAYYAESQYKSLCGDTCGVAFLIDMDNRKIYIFSNWEFANKITSNKADQIADKIYRYATNKDYFSCAKEGLKLIDNTLQGKFLFSPMKLTTSILLGFAIALLACIIIVYFQRQQFGKLRDLTEGNEKIEMNVVANLVHVQKTRHVEHSSGGGHGGGGGGGHSSGGGHGF